MQNPSESPARPRTAKLWLIIGGALIAFCIVVALGVVFGVPLVQMALESPTPTGVATASPGPAEGGRGDGLLKSDVWNSILGFYSSNRNCTDVTNTKVEVTQVPDSSGVWQEDWSVVACGETAVLTIKFTPSPQGGTDYHISQ